MPSSWSPLTNEKRGGLAVVSFDRSGFKLFLLWFSNKSMQAPSCERHKTAQWTLFLLFANNNCFPTSEEKLLALFEFRRFFGSWGGGQHSLVVCCIASFFKKFGGFLKLHHRWLQWLQSNYSDATNIGEKPFLVIWKDLWWSRLLPSSQMSGRMYNTVVSIKYMLWKVCHSPT